MGVAANSPRESVRLGKDGNRGCLSRESIRDERVPRFVFSSEQRQALGKYVEEQPIMSRTTLHAARLTFEHPSTLERVHFEVAAPKDFLATLTQLGKWDV